jgi:hypothetical protein
MGAMALHGYSSMELKSRSFTSKEPHVAREPQVADPWSRGSILLSCVPTYLTARSYDPEGHNIDILYYIELRINM